MAAQGRSGSGRREFGRVALASLAAGARAELERRRARGQRLRARRAQHRLEELEQALDRLERGIPPLPPRWYARRGATGVALALLVAALAALAVTVALHGPAGVLVGVVDLAMLLAALLWFCVAVARRGPASGVAVPPSNEGSPPVDRGR